MFLQGLLYYPWAYSSSNSRVIRGDDLGGVPALRVALVVDVSDLVPREPSFKLFIKNYHFLRSRL